MRAGARDFVGKIGIVGLKTELHGVEPGLAQFAGPRFVQTDAARDEICVKFCRARAVNEFGQIVPNERFTAGETDLQHAKLGRFTKHPAPFIRRQVSVTSRARRIGAVRAMKWTPIREFGEQRVGARRGHESSTSLRSCKSATISRTSAASVARSASYSSANAQAISLSGRPSQRVRISWAASFSSPMPSGKSSTLLPVAESICNRTPGARRGRASSAIGAGISMVNRVKHGPENVAFKFERADCGILQLARIAIFQSNRKRFAGIAPRLGDSAAKIIEVAWVDPGVELLETRQPRRHQIRRKKLCERRCDRDRPWLHARKVHVGIDGKADPRQKMPIFQQFIA